MTVPLIITGVVVVAFIAWAVQMSRRQSATKKAAIAELQEEQEKLTSFDIHALVEAEVNDLGLREVAGSADIPDSVLLKTWNESRHIVSGCPSRDLLTFVVRDGVERSHAMDEDVRLVCTEVAGEAASEAETTAEDS